MFAVTRGRGSVLPAAAGSMAGLLPNHTSSPMMPGFVTASPMSLDQVAPASQVAMPQPMSVAQMQVGCSCRFSFYGPDGDPQCQ